MTARAYQDDFHGQDEDGLEWDGDEEEEPEQDGDGDDRHVSLLAKDQYFRQVAWTEPLLKEEEAVLLQRVECGRLEGDKLSPNQSVLSLAKYACDRLVEGYQLLVIHIAHHYQGRFRSMDLLDLIQEGNVGLLEAIERYDGRREFPFNKLAGACIGSAVCDALYDRDRTIRVASRTIEIMSRKQKVEARLAVELGRDPSFAEIAGEMGMQEANLRELFALDQRAQQVGSLDALMQANPEYEENLVAVFEVPVGTQMQLDEKLQVALQRALAIELTERQREVIYLRYGFGEPVESDLSYAEIAQRIGCSKSGAVKSDRVVKARLYELLAPLVCQKGEVA